MSAPVILGHRGHPRWENTLRGLDACVAAAGLDGAEIDVQLLADGTVVVVHDLDLRRLAGDPRHVAQLRADELETITVLGERIPTLAQWLARWPADRWLNVELKAGGAAQGARGETHHDTSDEKSGARSRAGFHHGLLVEAVLALLQGRSKIVISSFDPSMLEAAAARGCEHELALLLAAESPAWLHVDGGRSFGCRSVHLHAGLVAPAGIARYAAHGLAVGCWGARDREHERRLAELGVARVITDFID